MMMNPGTTLSSKKEQREYECVVNGIAASGTSKFVSRVHALCDDGCIRVSEVRVHEAVFHRRAADKGTGIGSGASAQEIRVRRTIGDQIQAGNKTKICAAGQTKKLAGVESLERVEILQHGLFQRAELKKLETGVRSITRIAVSGHVEAFLEAMGFSKRYEVFYRGEKILNRDGIEVEMFRLTTSREGTKFIVPKGSSTVDESPLIVTVRAVAPSESEIEKTSQRIRSLVNDLLASSSFEEVKLEAYVSRTGIR